ncbi:MAG TPA: hypothetical protein VFK13_02440 [Gemmatimonadaceae bacterium]|nr:hypothetical protein [Gemmatimonadaceae bacterium]
MPSSSRSAARRASAVRLLAAAALFSGAALLAAACTDSTASQIGADRSTPFVSVAANDAPNDTTLSFTVHAGDNLGLKRVLVTVTGGVVSVFDTTMTSAVTALDLPFDLTVPSSVAPGTPVIIVAQATDGAANVSPPDTLSLAVGNVAPALVIITSPASGSAAVVGKSVVLSISARSALKVARVGWLATGVASFGDSTLFATPLKDSVPVIDTLNVPSTAGTGQLTVTPFLVDSLGQRVTGNPITLNVQTAAATGSVPVVDFQVNPRIEVTDTVHVEATDPTGVTNIGYEVRTLAGVLIAADSVSSTGQITQLLERFDLSLPITTFPTSVTVSAFATNSIGTRAFALRGGVTRLDTVVVVAGVTRGLPNGGRLADGLYHPNTDRLYLTNIDRNEVEVFNLADSSFLTPIVVGSRPWGIAPWPRDRNGTMGDTLLVANSGGTNISYINLNAGTTGAEVYRYALPNIIVSTVTTELSSITGQPFQKKTEHDFSDRPQYLATTCQGPTAPGSLCGDVILVYSTTPTGGQTKPFEKKGTIRWEDLSDSTSHFFFEQAMGQGEGRADTLEIERLAALGTGSDSVLVPFLQRGVGAPLTDSAALFSVVVRIDALGFRDTTFVRNSGNFRRAVLGEGGDVDGSRALMYDATSGMQSTFVGADGTVWPIPTPVIDNGVSRAVDVSDYQGNAFADVKGVAINFDGALSAIRADSTYIIDPTLRLQGLLQTTGANAGFDFHPQNTGVNSAGNTRLAFAAAADPVIEVYDTFCFRRVGLIPVRDPIIGPIKASLRGANIVLVGATATGVVIVTVPNTLATTCP